MAGRVYLVGAGPGAWDLVTVRGLRLLSTADVVVYDRLVSRELLEYARPGAGLVYAGKAPGRHVLSQEEINMLLLEEALRGRTVVRLHGGDPLHYGRGEEECAFLRANRVPCEVVPGVPSTLGASAEYLLPLGSRGYSRVYTVATGTTMEGPLPRERLRAAVRASDTLVLLMASRRLGEAAEAAVEERGPETPVAVVERATMPGSRLIVSTAGRIARDPPRVEPPALVYLGGAVAWRLENLPAPRYY